ncbi:AsmA-like C-terminal region-containing protein [Lentimicrobium sp. S6]|uniref:AsmA-like C-terminal region-containing protein n=1 Tax=Lentimicrobium sp. S6 TaxID=2735872 RepID=UPI001554754D|nr:AsmA-like C-terminal region-containing protein [Lentimicrobium sp. S6]NPD44215.1 AsmA family protein [Lentimicrobium sp. S6]
MKKFIKWFLIIIVFILAILIILPMAFQGKITKIAKQEINKNVNARVNFEEVKLSLITSFPDLSFKMNEISVIGVDHFEGDTLAYIKQFRLDLGLLSILNDPIEIKSIIFKHPQVYTKVLEDGKANWDIALEEETVEEETSNDSEPAMVLSLRNFSIIGAEIIYEDQSMDLFTKMENLNFNLSGDLSSDYTTLSTKSTIDAMSLKMEGLSYLKKAKMELIADLETDLVKSKYTFKENILKVNELELGFDGSVEMPSDDIIVDIVFDAKQTAFKNILSLVPAVYMTDFQDLKTAGQLSLKGKVKGIYNENQLPAFNLNLLVKEAMFQYPDLPSKVENISMDLAIDNADGIEDHTIINLKTFHMDMAGNPFDMNMLVKTPVSDPSIDGKINGTIDLGKMKDLLPSEDMNMSGTIKANMEMKGKMSSIENEDYEDFYAVGNIAIQNLNYKDTDLPQGIHIKSAKAIISPQFVNLDHFKAEIGESDMNMKGKIENFLAFYFKDELLKGDFSFTSNKLNMADLMGEETDELESNSEEESEELAVIEIPKNIDFTLNTEIDELLYDNMEIKNIRGDLQLKDGIASLDDLNMNMLDGSLKMNGQYSSQDLEKPSFDFDMDAVNFNVKETFETFNTIQKIAPIAKNMEGNISAKMNIDGILLQNMEPDLGTVNSKGRLQSNSLAIKNAELFKQVGSLIKSDKFNQLSLDNMDLTYTMTNGNIDLKPFDTKFGKSKMTIGGSQNINQNIDYYMDFNIPSSELGSQANAVASQLFAEAGKLGLDVQTPETIKFKALIGGTLSQPKVGLDLKNSASNMADDLKKQAELKLKQEKDKAKKQAIDEAKKQAAQLMAEADKQGKKLISEAQKVASQAKAEANKQADIAKAETYKQADALIKEAGDDTMKKLIAKTAADKLKAEADKTAENFKKEAAAQADKGVNVAKKQSDALKVTAKKQGDALIVKAEKV